MLLRGNYAGARILLRALQNHPGALGQGCIQLRQMMWGLLLYILRCLVLLLVVAACVQG
jgi:hypothetical protein